MSPSHAPLTALRHHSGLRRASGASLVSAAFFLVATSLTAHAYIGPGMGGGALAATLGIVIAFVLILVGLVW
jgi:hypothetical protein